MWVLEQRWGGASLQVEKLLQPYYETPVLYHLPDSSENARHVALAAYGVVAKGEGLPQRAQDDLMVG